MLRDFIESLRTTGTSESRVDLNNTFHIESVSQAGDIYAKYCCRNEQELFMRKARAYVEGLTEVKPVDVP